jgi:hypothetical protein
MAPSDVRSLKRRGSAYIAVLGTSVIIAVIALGAILALRMDQRSAVAAEEMVQAELLAEAAIELGFEQTRSLGDASLLPGLSAWAPDVSLGEGTCTWKFEPTGPILLGPGVDPEMWLYGKGTVGDTVRIHRVLLRPRDQDTSNLVDNPGVESGTTGWSSYAGCQIQSYGSDAYSGGQSLRVYNRGEWYTGAGQSLLNKIENGASYQMEAWGRLLWDSSKARITAYTKGSGDGGQWFTGPWKQLTSSDWSSVTAFHTLSWVGTLENAYWKLETQSGDPLTDYLIDDATIRKGGSTAKIEVEPVSGRWERVLVP